MSEFRPYFEQLLKRHRVYVEKQHLHLFDTFVKEESIIEAFNLIRNIQLTMIDKWKEKIQVEDIKAKQIVLPNGTVGKAYEFIFDFAQLKLNDIGDYNVQADEKLGIAFNKAENNIYGVLKEAGEHTLTFSFKLRNDTEEKPFYTKEIKLIVNPDPKSLWKNDATPIDIDYYKPDDVSASVEFGMHRLIVGSKRGRSHAHEAKPRDDAFDFTFQDETGWGIIAVADGAGSAKYSRKGSEIACESVVEFFKNIEKETIDEIESSIQDYLSDESDEKRNKLSTLLGGQLLKAAFTAQQNIKEESTKMKSDVKNYSTTLIFAIVKKYPNKYLIASFWVGDGGIGIYNKETNEVSVLGTPDSGEFAGQTRFLTMNEIFSDSSVYNRIKLKFVDNFTALILMTDGISDPKFQTDFNLNKIEKWNELWDDLNGSNLDSSKVDFSKPIEEVKNDLMNWLDFWSPGNHDDRTIAILY
jgi:serine/threonine protein phosphatase PrpC